jgi:dephospho-CoA kinase
MGKSTVARMFARLGVPGFDADQVVHQLQAPGGPAIAALMAAFPGTVKDGVLDRAALRAIVFSDAAALRRLEGIMHPLVRRAETKFRAAARRAGRRAVLLDIPLLFESGAKKRVDVTVTVSAPRDVQMARVRRRGLADAQIEKIIASQLPDQEKRRRADFVVPTGLSKFATMRAVRRIYGRLVL